jgi:uncharacterized protein (TIRG00374 family)
MNISLLIKVVISTGLLGWFLSQCDILAMRSAVLDLPLIWIVYAVIAVFVSSLLNAFRWRLLLPGFSFPTLIRYTFVGLYYGMVLPGQLAGELAKAYSLGRGRKDAETIAASVLVDRVVALLAIIGLGIAGLMFGSLGQDNLVLPVSAVFLAAVLMLISLRLPFVLRVLLICLDKVETISVVERMTGQIRRFILAWRDYLHRPSLLVASFVLGIVFQMVGITVTWMLAKGIGVDVAWIDCWWIVAAVSLTLVLPITIAGMGVREGVFVGLLQLYGATVSEAVTLSLLTFMVAIPPALCGAILAVQAPNKKTIDTIT